MVGEKREDVCTLVRWSLDRKQTGNARLRQAMQGQERGLRVNTHVLGVHWERKGQPVSQRHGAAC